MAKRVNANWYWTADEAELRAARRREFWVGVRGGYVIGTALGILAAAVYALVVLGGKL